MAKYVKLGAKANGFYSMNLDLSIAKGQVLEISNEMMADKKFSTALKGGHLEFSNEEEFNEFQKSDLAKFYQTTPSTDVKKEEEEEDGEEGELTLEMIPTGKKKIIKFLNKHFDDLDPNMDKMEEEELVEYAKNLINPGE